MHATKDIKNPISRCLLIMVYFVDFCESSPCENGGSCSELDGGFLCQ